MYLSNFSVKQANKRFNTTGHDYELSLRADSEVCSHTPASSHLSFFSSFQMQPCRDASIIANQKVSYHFTKLSRIAEHGDQCIDILAIVDSVDEPIEVIFKLCYSFSHDFPFQGTARNNGRPYVKRVIHLVDQEAIVDFTLWGDEAKAFDTSHLGEVVAIKGANVREFRGALVFIGCHFASEIRFHFQTPSRWARWAVLAWTTIRDSMRPTTRCMRSTDGTKQSVPRPICSRSAVQS
jgi:hypothetical protein